MDLKNPSPKTFEISKVNSKRKRIIFFIEILVVFSLVAGITFSFLNLNNFNYPKIFEAIKGTLNLKQAQQHKDLSFEEKARNLIDKKILDITELKKTDQGLDIKTKQGIEVFISDDKDLGDQVKTLQTVLSKAKIEKREVLLIDFRFDKLVVRYK